MAAREGRNVSGPATVSLGRAAFLADGTWRVDPSGAPAVLVPVRDRLGDWVDIVAYHIDQPCEWRVRFNDCSPVLGGEALAMAAYHHDPVALFSTPERWLLSQWRTSPPPVCVLDWGVDLGPLFDGVSHVECDSPALRDRFRKALRSWEPKMSTRRSHPARSFRAVRDAA